MNGTNGRTSLIRNQIMIATVLVAQVGCEKSASETPKAAAAVPATTTYPVAEADLNKIELSEDAVRRLGLETATVATRPMRRTRPYGADLLLPTGASILVSAPVAGTLQVLPGSQFPQIGQRVSENETLLSLLPMLSPERDVLTPAERIRLAEARNAVAQSQIDADAQLQQSTVMVEAARIALERAERLLKDKSGTVRTVDEAQAQLQLAEKSLEAARIRKQIVDSIELDTEAGTVRPLTIKSPLVGLVRSIQAQPGQMLAAGGPLMEVMDDRRLWIKVPVYVGDLEEIDATQQARLTLLDGRQTDQDLFVEPIAAPPTAMALASTVDLYFDLPNPDFTFRPGQKVAAHLMLKGEAESVAIPWSAVYHDIYGGQWVYEQVAERQFVRRRVNVSTVSEGWAAVSRGPEVGRQVVIAGVAELAGTEFGFAK